MMVTSFKRGLFAILLGMGLSNFAHAAEVKNCKVTFETIGKPVLVQIQGTSGHPCTGTYTLKGSELKEAKFVMKMDQLETGIELRNKHLRENYLHTNEYPESVLTIKSIDDLAKQLKSGGGESKFVPELTLRGATSEISGAKYEIKGKQVHAEFRIELTDFKIERPMFMGIKVVDAVIVRVDFDM